MKTKIPLIISIPHGGDRVPEEVKEKFMLDQQEVLRDGDTWTRELFDFEVEVKYLITTEVPRVVVDLNRGKRDLPPENFDGVVKTKSVFLNQVWKDPLETGEREALFKAYYDPYFNKLHDAAGDREVKLGIDCHSMLPEDPFNKDAEKRPLFCISNRGGQMGEELDEPLTATQDLMVEIKEIFEDVFGQGSVRLNDPFKGGYITKHMAWKKGIPWIQLEVNRILYMPMEGKLSVHPGGKDKERVEGINRKLLTCLKRIQGSSEE